MTEVIIRPTLKFIKAAYGTILLVAAVAGWMAMQDTVPAWAPAVIALLLLWPAERHIRRQSTRLILTGDKLRYESGFLSKTTRTISLAKVQDVSVHQSLGQRMTATGDLAIETAGEASRLTVRSIDSPQRLADQIHEASEQAAKHGPTPGAGKGHGV
jgi:uncharacterized membrane protein YdbT with pleckstrin-like domain